MRVLVTGGAGFIGANLVRKLTRHLGGADVVVLDDLSFGYRENLEGTGVEFLEGSVLDRDLLSKAIEGVSTVVHLAARSFLKVKVSILTQPQLT